MKNIALIGSTGSIGRQVLKVVENHPESFSVCALAANSPSEEFSRQAEKFKPALIALASVDKAGAIAAASMPQADIVFNAAAGFAGLEYSLAALGAGKNLALANKETLVCGGQLALGAAKKTGAEIIPVDSEHSAIWQCMGFDRNCAVRRLIITASGGAFRGYTPEMLEKVTPEQALNHPTWKMGRKITVDSATLMNKGYEVIEAHVLFGVPYSRIETAIQPQSIVHSLVEFEDGAVLAQMSYPTMELPIQLALTYPERLKTELAPMDFTRAFSLGFEPLERKKFPLYDLALGCGEAGGILPCVLNAADEVAVHAFLNKKLRYVDIFKVAEGVTQRFSAEKYQSFQQLDEADKRARALAEELVNKYRV